MLVGVMLGASAPPAQAMCGGNIFMTCPPNPKAEANDKRNAERRERRLRSVREKKRHYPVRMR